jgi:hypothetical protein
MSLGLSDLTRACLLTLTLTYLIKSFALPSASPIHVSCLHRCAYAIFVNLPQTLPYNALLLLLPILVILVPLEANIGRFEQRFYEIVDKFIDAIPVAAV